MSEQQIERDAQNLLDTYFDEQGTSIQIPIPADDILEIHLGLSLDFDNLPAVLGIPDVLGALWVERREVFIDESLDPFENPELEGRYYFSVAHETGHWRLHRHYLMNAGDQTAKSPPTVICRTSQAKERIEWQADYFASCLLMPRALVFEAWKNRFGSVRPVVSADIIEQTWLGELLRQGITPALFMRSMQNNLFRKVAQQFAPLFRVSTQAMQIRLENLGLLRDKHPDEQDLFAGQ